MVTRSDDALRVSVIICTHSSDRYERLEVAVASAVAEQPDEVVIVVDHNPEVLARSLGLVRGRNLRTDVRVIENHNVRGLSGARNAGIASSKHPVVAFVDDDAELLPGWMGHLTAPFDDATVVAVGGRALPARPDRFPSWWPREFDWTVGCSWIGLPDTVTEVRNVIGCTMAFRRAALEGTTGFHTALGRVGNNAAGCEETELCIQLRRRGGRVIYEPLATVLHHIDDHRLTPSYFVRRCWAEGRSKAFIRRHVDRDALRPERRFAVQTLRRSVAVGGRAIVARNWSAMARAVVMVFGLVVTALGFAAPTPRALRGAGGGVHRQQHPMRTNTAREAS